MSLAAQDTSTIANARQAFEMAINPPQPPVALKHETLQKLLLSSWGQAVAASLIVMLALWIINPPMIQTRKENEIENSSHRSMTKVLVWGGITGVLVMTVPLIVKRLSK